MPERAPFKADNRRATGIAVASIGFLLLAVTLAHFGVISPPDLRAPHGQNAKPAALPADAATLPEQTGAASWYAFDGEETANGETMDPGRLTAAHPTLPFGTKVEVENLENGRTVVVRVNDREPYADDRIIDVSKAAAHRLGMAEDGVTDVNVAPVPTDSVDDPGEPLID